MYSSNIIQGGGRLFVDYIDIVDICQCAAACVIMMPCPHHGNVYTVPAHTVCTQTHFIFKYYIINIRGGVYKCHKPDDVIRECSLTSENVHWRYKYLVPNSLVLFANLHNIIGPKPNTKRAFIENTLSEILSENKCYQVLPENLIKCPCLKKYKVGYFTSWDVII